VPKGNKHNQQPTRSATMATSAQEASIWDTDGGSGHERAHEELASISLAVHTLAVSQAPKLFTESNNSSNRSIEMGRQNSRTWSEAETACAEAYMYGPDEWSGDECAPSHRTLTAGAKMAMELHKTTEANSHATPTLSHSSGRLARSTSERTLQVCLDNIKRPLARSCSEDKLNGCLNGTCAVLKACICKKGPATASPRIMARPVINVTPNHGTSLAVAASGSNVTAAPLP